MANSLHIFSSLEKFSDGNGTELNAFLSKFDRCCVISNKADGNVPVKGQLLMMFVEGRARAALEEYELSQNGQQQNYDALVIKLKEYFDNSSSRQRSMMLFENRKQRVNESEEEFMLALLRLYQAANPEQAAAVTLLAIKRKFLAGISPALRNKVFVFCTDPYAANVSRETLLGHCRTAQNLLSMSGEGETGYERSTDRVLLTSTGMGAESGLLAAINNISLQLNDHVQSTELRLDEFGGTLAAITQGNNLRGRGTWNGRGNNRGSGGNYRGSFNRGGFGGNRGGFNNNGGFNRGGFNNNGGFNRGGFNNNNRGNNRGGYSNRGRGGGSDTATDDDKVRFQSGHLIGKARAALPCFR